MSAILLLFIDIVFILLVLHLFVLILYLFVAVWLTLQQQILTVTSYRGYLPGSAGLVPFRSVQCLFHFYIAD